MRPIESHRVPCRADLRVSHESHGVPRRKPTEAETLRAAADCLYPSDDPRFTPWPSEAELSRMRSVVRSIADWIEHEEPSSPRELPRPRTRHTTKGT